jgi:hypothetical protein
MDTLGLAPAEIWEHRSDKRLSLDLVRVALHQQLPLGIFNFERVGSTDSESFAARRIPRITIHSLTQKNYAILHTKKDNIAAINLDDYYATYRLVAVYLAYLDYAFSKPEPAVK